MPHVILIEDDALVRKLLEKRLQMAGWRVSARRDGRDLMQLVRNDPADLIAMDLGLPDVDGLSLVEELRANGVDTPVLILTAYDLPHLYATIRSTGANDLVQKPYDPEELVARMAKLMAA